MQFLSAAAECGVVGHENGRQPMPPGRTAQARSRDLRFRTGSKQTFDVLGQSYVRLVPFAAVGQAAIGPESLGQLSAHCRSLRPLRASPKGGHPLRISDKPSPSKCGRLYLRAEASALLLSFDSSVGGSVLNREGDRLGHVDDLSIEKVSGWTIYATMSFCGFLGI